MTTSIMFINDGFDLSMITPEIQEAGFVTSVCDARRARDLLSIATICHFNGKTVKAVERLGKELGFSVQDPAFYADHPVKMSDNYEMILARCPQLDGTVTWLWIRPKRL